MLLACGGGDIKFSGGTFLSVQSANVLTPTQQSQTLVISNPTRNSVAWGLSLEPSPDNPKAGSWFSLDSAQGNLPVGATATLTLTLSSGLPPGLYRTTATISYGNQKERLIIVGQIPGGVSGTANLNGTVITDNSLIAVPNTLTSGTLLETTEPETTTPTTYVPGQLLVKYKESTETPSSLTAQQFDRQSLVQSLQADYDLQVLEARAPGESDLLATTQDVEAVAKALSRDPRVEYATPNYYLQALELPNDPLLQEQFALSMAGLPVAWNLETGSSNDVTVAVLDTGFDLNHEDLAGRFLPGYDFCGQYKDLDPFDEETGFTCQNTDNDPGFGEPTNSHGTHVTGILGAVGNNARGIAGVAYGTTVKILPVKIFSDVGIGANLDTFTKGMKWAVGLEVTGTPKNEYPARIINLSLGGEFYEEDGDDDNSNNPVNQSALRFMQDAVDEANRAGALIVAATGNSNKPFILSPAAADKVLAVGSVETNLVRSDFSNYSAQQRFGPGTVDLMTPGNGILSTIPDNGFGLYGQLQGTSMSAPLVSGIAALILSREPQLDPSELEARLLSAAYFEPALMKQTEFGKGVLRADLALGLPGPGSTVTVALGGPSTPSSLTTTTLDFYGGSDSFTLPNLAAGAYRLTAMSNGSGKQLATTQQISLQDAESQTLSLELESP
jgi:serine protease